MRVTADANLLVRLVTRDDEAQAQTAYRLLSTAERVVITLPSLCEMVWVLRSIYRFSNQECATAVRTVTDPPNVVHDVSAVEAGIHLLDAGGDFADAAIARSGIDQGGDIFISFDRKAVAQLNSFGLPARDASEIT